MPQEPASASASAQPAPPGAPAGPAPEPAAPCPAEEAPASPPIRPPADAPEAPLSSAAQADAPPDQAASPADAPPEQPSQAEPAPSRQQSPALLDILQRAQALFAPQESQAASVSSQTPAPKPISNPFPRAFPQSAWKRVEYPGRPGHYLVGEGVGRGGAYTVYALPGVYAPVSRQPGFGRFLRAADGSGYWVRIVPRRG